ncbi:hypothetical protein Pst134EB_018585 [Puccinia striiformis f. sp. tritici]|nr:hypothetical protein Pst134EB_018585 [Puccinia striiformis f. sp. tritici]
MDEILPELIAIFHFQLPSRRELGTSSPLRHSKKFFSCQDHEALLRSYAGLSSLHAPSPLVVNSSLRLTPMRLHVSTKTKENIHFCGDLRVTHSLSLSATRPI